MSSACESDLITAELPGPYNYLAPDGSEIRLLPSMRGGGLAHCTLPPGSVTQAVAHRTVEEIWYCLSGEGQIWRKMGLAESIAELRAGVSVTIPTGASFQFRATGGEPLRILIATMPPWPGKDEAVLVEGYWAGASE